MADDAARLRHQADLVLAWVSGDDARRAAMSLVARHGLDLDGDDLVQQAWVRVTTSLGVRIEPLPSVDGPDDAARYGYRILANLAIDAARAVNRRSSLAAAIEPGRDPAGPEDEIVSSVFYEEFLRRFGATPIRAGNCGGCSPETIRSIALRAVQSIALERDRTVAPSGRLSFDAIIDEALGRVTSSGGSANWRKRKSRCIGCVREVVARVMSEMEDGRD